MSIRTLTAPAVVLLLAGLSACGDDGGSDRDAAAASSSASSSTTTTEAADTSATTRPAADTPTQAAFPSGAGVTHPSSWTSWGTGFTGSIELGIPGVANVSVRDAAASEYMYGPMLPDQETLEGAFAMMEFGMGSAAIGERSLVTVDGRDILHATVDNAGKEGVMAVMASGDSYASVYAESTGPPLSEDTVEAVLQVLASITP